MHKTLQKLIKIAPITGLFTFACNNHAVFAMTPNNINIAKLYRNTGSGSKASNSNYVMLQNGMILFYSPAIRDRLVKLSLEAQEPFSTSTMILDPKTKEQKWGKSVFSWKDNLVYCDNQPSLPSETDRLRLGLAWKMVFELCIKYNSNPMNEPERLYQSSILRINPEQFLISNGYSSLTARKDYAWNLNSAALFDINSKRIIKTYSLKQARTCGASIKLTDGRVLLLGGEGPNSETFTYAEVLNLESGKSNLLPIKIRTRQGISVCMDTSENIYVTGGYGASVIEPAIADILQISIKDNSIKTIGQLLKLRRYPCAANFNTVPNNTAIINNELMVTGGNEHDPGNSYDFKYPKNIEFHEIPDK
jgi:hypothetical protein